MAEGRIEWNVTELQLSSEHSKCLDQREPETVKKWITSGRSIILVKQDVKRASEGDENEEETKHESWGPENLNKKFLEAFNA